MRGLFWTQGCQSESSQIVKSISLKCLLAFFEALKDALLNVVDESGSVGAWFRLLLLPRYTLQVVQPHNRQDCRFGNRKTLQQHHILECLTTWRDAYGLVKLVDSVFGSPEQEKLGHEEVHIDKRYAKVSSNVKQCLRKVADSHFTAVVEVLGSSVIAPYNAHIL
ncbi:unnamed protein product [Vicia faba]|uniref:Uncharacterized protein n=1 Tax=Vicia faba TaxID=3906 RepID=A0AAV0YHM9_VICFA|nr:unnamed protein product [Vicia faba]